MSLEVTFGPMFSGKTTYLIEKLDKIITVKNNYSGKTFKGLLINSSQDTRKKSVFNLSTHGKMNSMTNENITAISVSHLSILDDVYIGSYDYISIDECQFFDDLVDNVKRWVSQGRHMHCSGLVADINQNTFGHLIELIPFADDVVHKKAICVKCLNGFNKGVFTKRKEDSKCELILISGKEDYYPVCREHF